ncbi:MAG: DNA polymerase III subunit gamma/tau [Bacilli bacterium]|nr:DNA polymerase III subunit gamma/tau [Bacilli bacterium]
MSYISLYRKYRPKTFSDVVGQDVVKTVLKNSISSNQISHAYIFSGPRGTGKTSIAKIFAKAVNCRQPVEGDLCGECEVCSSSFDENIDIVEIDAASNNGVDEIREIRNNVTLLPANLKYKVYIIDEVHMLTTNAFNALLKTLEEPPSHVIFILATTEFNKIPATVVSRCQKFDFKKISKRNLILRLKYILEKEEKSLPDDVIDLVADLSDGGLRDAINLVDQLLSVSDTSNISVDDVYNLVGELSDNEIMNLMNSIFNCDIKDILNKVNQYFTDGRNFISICNRLQLLVRNLIIYNSTNDYFDKRYEEKLSQFSRIDYDKFLILSKEFFELLSLIKKSDDPKVLVEIYFIKCALIFDDSNLKNNVKIEEVKTEIKNDLPKNEEKIDIKSENLEQKQIRINNAFSGANKELKQKFVEKFTEISEFMSSKNYNSVANLMMKSSIEVVSETEIIFSFKNSFEVVLFDKNINEIQKLLKEVYGKNFNIVALSNEEWNKEKDNYVKNINNGIKYEYIVEKKVVKSSKKKTELQSSLEGIFGDDMITED